MIAYTHDPTQPIGTNPPTQPEESIQERIFNELRAEKYRDQAELWRLREETADQQELIAQLQTDRPDAELLEEKDATIAELRSRLEDMTAKYRYQEEVNHNNSLKFAYIALEDDRQKRLLSNHHMSGNQKVIFQAIENEIRDQTSDPTEYTHVNMLAIEERTGLGHNCVSKEVGRLQEWGAWKRDDTFEERIKRGKKIVVDKISLSMTDLAIHSPQDIRPGAGEERNHGGKRDRCERCKSTNVRRLFHLQCLDCGHEYVNRHDPEEDALEIVSLTSDQGNGSEVPQQGGQGERSKNVGQHTSSQHSHLRLLTNDQEETAQLIQVERVTPDHRHDQQEVTNPVACTTPAPLVEEQTSELDTRNQTSSSDQPAQLIQVERVTPDQEPPELDTLNPTPIDTKLQEKPVPGQKLGACLVQREYNKNGQTPQAKNHEKTAYTRDCGCTRWYPVGGEDEYICAKCFSPIAWTRKIRAERGQC